MAYARTSSAVLGFQNHLLAADADPPKQGVLAGRRLDDRSINDQDEWRYSECCRDGRAAVDARMHPERPASRSRQRARRRPNGPWAARLPWRPSAVTATRSAQAALACCCCCNECGAAFRYRQPHAVAAQDNLTARAPSTRCVSVRLRALRTRTACVAKVAFTNDFVKKVK